MSITPSVQFRKDSALLEWWRTQSGTAEAGTIRLQAVVKGGSVRRFYRIQVDGESRGILMEYSPEKEENHVFAEVARFLSCLGVPVPEIFVHDPQNHLMWLEDLGDCDLESYCARNHHDRMAVYRKVIGAILPLWQCTEIPDGLRTMPEFDARLYRWERDYYFDHHLKRLAPGRDESCREALHQALRPWEERLLNGPTGLVHRDFQSHNIMVREGQPGFVDFQGMRVGCWIYDLVSLLWDPYMDLGDGVRQILVAEAAEAMKWSGSATEWRQLVLAAGMQRLMQALGAYGFLGEGLGKKEFLQYVPVASSRLAVLAQEAGCEKQVVPGG